VGAHSVNVYNAVNGKLITSIVAFTPSFTGGVRVAVADVNGDGTPDIICGAGPGGGPEVAVFDGKTFQRIMDFEALPAQLTGGVWVAAGDINGDGYADIIVGADAGGGPQVTITSGRDGFQLTSFYATASTFTGGMYVSAGDLNGDGKADITVGAEKGGGPEVNVFNGAGISAGSGMPPSLYAFYALPPQFTGGVRVGYSSNFEGHQAILSDPSADQPRSSSLSGRGAADSVAQKPSRNCTWTLLAALSLVNASVSGKRVGAKASVSRAGNGSGRGGSIQAFAGTQSVTGAAASSWMTGSGSGRCGHSSFRMP
jgi:hypothetical protein